MGSSRCTSLRSTWMPVCAAIASATSAAVTEPKSLPSSPARAGMETLDAISVAATRLELDLLLRLA